MLHTLVGQIVVDVQSELKSHSTQRVKSERTYTVSVDFRASTFLATLCDVPLCVEYSLYGLLCGMHDVRTQNTASVASTPAKLPVN
jgi:hypothetical protein